MNNNSISNKEFMDPLDSLSDSGRKLEVELDDELRLHLGRRIEENNARATQKFVAFVAPQGTLDQAVSIALCSLW